MYVQTGTVALTAIMMDVSTLIYVEGNKTIPHQYTIVITFLSFFFVKKVQYYPHFCLKINWPRREKTCLRGFANNTGADQCLIRTFVIRILESTISKLATSEISFFQLALVAEQADLNLTLLETSKTGFVPTRPKCCGAHLKCLIEMPQMSMCGHKKCIFNFFITRKDMTQSVTSIDSTV